MSYKFRCNTCDRVFTSNSRSATCDRHGYYTRSATFIGEALDVAVDVATAYVMADVATDVLSGMADLVGGLFD